jgi:hypothetical protein
MASVTDFLLNRSAGAQEAQVVEAPAFSLTKVLASAAVVVTPIATLLVDKLADVNLTAWNYTVLAVAVLGFLAITASADVYSRAYATAAKEHATAATAAIGTAAAGLGHIVTFNEPIAGHHINNTPNVADPEVEVLASAYSDGPRLLVKENGSVTWLPAAEVKIP